MIERRVRPRIGALLRESKARWISASLGTGIATECVLVVFSMIASPFYYAATIIILDGENTNVYWKRKKDRVWRQNLHRARKSTKVIRLLPFAGNARTGTCLRSICLHARLRANNTLTEERQSTKQSLRANNSHARITSFQSDTLALALAARCTSPPTRTRFRLD